MSTQSLPIDTQLITQTWDHIARDSGLRPASESNRNMLELKGSTKWMTNRPFVGVANVTIRFIARRYEFLLLKEMSVEFTPDHPNSEYDYRMLKGETLLAFYHQRLVPNFMPKNRHCPFVVTCPQSLVILLARHNFVSSTLGYPVVFTALQGKTIAE